MSFEQVLLMFVKGCFGAEVYNLVVVKVVLMIVFDVFMDKVFFMMIRRFFLLKCV